MGEALASFDGFRPDLGIFFDRSAIPIFGGIQVSELLVTLA
jgi:hypothetical protein